MLRAARKKLIRIRVTIGMLRVASAERIWKAPMDRLPPASRVAAPMDAEICVAMLRKPRMMRGSRSSEVTR
jgi:hypothetical protein